MADIPYRPRVKLGSLRQTTKRMMVTKVGGAKVGDEKLKGFLKEDRGLRRMAYGDKASTVESWRGRKFVQTAKEKIESSDQYRQTVYGRKTTAAKAFRDTVKEEVRQEQATRPAGPSAEELAKQKRVELGKQRIHQYQRQLEVEKEQGRPLSGDQPPAAPDAGGAGGIKPVALGGGLGSTSATTAPGSTAIGTLGATTKSPPSAGALPDIFGLRGRALRVDSNRNEALVKVLNAPSELAVFIGRDQTLRLTKDSKVWRERSRIEPSEIVVGDRLDVRGKILNGALVADELYVNQVDLPDFVLQLGVSDVSVDVPGEPPSDLAIG